VTLRSSASLVAPGATFDLRRDSRRGALYLTYFAFVQVSAVTLPGFLGEALLDPTALAALPPTVLGTTGAPSLQVTVPVLPGLVGTSALFQGLSINPSADSSFSAPVFVGIC